MLAKVKSAGRTDVGKKRDSNQDQFIIADLNKSMLVQSTSLPLEADSRLYGMSHGKLFMVADGMGGHQGGNRASRMAIDILINQLLNSMHWFFRLESDTPDREAGFIEDLRSLLRRAHEAIEKEALAEVDKKGMGTTLTMAYVVWPWMYVIHAGDSRCYLLRGREMKQLTRDHTISNQLMEKAGMTADEASKSPWSNVLYNALGAGAESVNPEVHKVALEAGDAIMLCSDGLYRHVRDNEFRDKLSTEVDPEAACNSLIELANFRGGFDNITCVVARFGTPEDAVPKTRSASDITLERLVSQTIVYKPDEIIELQKSSLRLGVQEPAAEPIHDTIDFTPTEDAGGDISDTLDLATSPLSPLANKEKSPQAITEKQIPEAVTPETPATSAIEKTLVLPESLEPLVEQQLNVPSVNENGSSTDEYVVQSESESKSTSSESKVLTEPSNTSETASSEASTDEFKVTDSTTPATKTTEAKPAIDPKAQDTIEFDPTDPKK